jgi:hypothetical protein
MPIYRDGTLLVTKPLSGIKTKKYVNQNQKSNEEENPRIPNESDRRPSTLVLRGCKSKNSNSITIVIFS